MYDNHAAQNGSKVGPQSRYIMCLAPLGKSVRRGFVVSPGLWALREHGMHDPKQGLGPEHCLGPERGLGDLVSLPSLRTFNFVFFLLWSLWAS